jgi:formamidopyrimidine-DNA glycosylase
MPELPEVETVRRGLVPVLEGAVIADVTLRRTMLRVPVPADFVRRLVGNRIVRVGRRAKYLLIEMTDGTVVIGHLGMSGHMTIHRGAPPPPQKHDHIDFTTDSGFVVRFTDPRRFGLFLLDHMDTIDSHPLMRHLGPDPLSNAFNGIILAERLAGRATPIKAALLDQRTIAGLGNIYVCESLFRAGLSPRRLARTVKNDRAERLALSIREVLGEAIAAGGTTLRDHVSPDGELGYFQHRFAVYSKEGEPCPGCICERAHTGAQTHAKPGGGIKRIVQAGRSTFYCPTRQR